MNITQMLADFELLKGINDEEFLAIVDMALTSIDSDLPSYDEFLRFVTLVAASPAPRMPHDVHEHMHEHPRRLFMRVLFENFTRGPHHVKPEYQSFSVSEYYKKRGEK